MKKVFLLVIILTGSIGFSACAQSKNPPKAVTDAFAKKFPQAKNAKWDMENKSEWEAEFKMDKIEYSANFSTDGKWLESEHEIDLKKIPSIVIQNVMNVYPSAKIEKLEVVEKPGNKMVYEMIVEADGKDMELVVDQSGKIIKKKMENDEDSDSED